MTTPPLSPVDGADHGSRLAQVLAGLVTVDGEPSVLARLCRLCATTTRSSAGLSLMTTGAGDWTLVASAGDLAEHAEQAQSLVGEGPRADVARDRRPVLQPDLLRTGPRRWPVFTAEATASGARAAFVFPLQIGAIMMGTLGLYRAEPGMLTAGELSDALTFTDAATHILLHLQDGSADDDPHQALAEPLTGHAEVHQATGMASVQLDVSLAEALLRLRARAYADSRPLADLAADVVARRIRLDHANDG